MRLKKYLLVLMVLLVASTGIRSQGIDFTYIADFGLDTGIQGHMMIPLPGGKILAYLPRNNYRIVRRINADGSIDRTFNCACEGMYIHTMAVTPDGKYILAGSNEDTVSPDIIRVNSSGTRDTTFTSPFPSAAIYARVYAVTPGGKIYAVGLSGNGGSLYRLNTDGSVDNAFTPIFFNNLGVQFSINIYKVALLPDGKIYVAGQGIQPAPVFRANADGSIDNTFTLPVYEPAGALTLNNAIPQPDGKVVISGNFTKVNGLTRRGIARLNADGSVDSAEAPISPDGGWYTLALSDGKIFLANGTQRLNLDLSIDNTFQGGGSSGPTIVDSGDRLVSTSQTGLFRRNYDGSPDNTFNFRLPDPGTVASLALQADGKVLAAGRFEFVNGVRQRSIARLNPDGTRDSSFNVGQGFSTGSNVASIAKVAIEPSGKILVFGDFTSYNGTQVLTFARIHPNGDFDSSFPAFTGSGVASIGVQPDGKILLFGGSMGLNGFTRTMVARLNNDGTLDTAFNPQIPSPVYNDAFLQPDGKIMIGGAFSTVNGVSRQNLARLNNDGSLDASFNAGSIGAVRKIARQPDGKYIVAPNANGAITRLNSDGSVDPSFSSLLMAGAAVNAIMPEPGGSVIIAGGILGPQTGVFRLRSDGSFDPAFLSPGVNGTVYDMVRQLDRKIIIGGKYYSVAGNYALSLSRINVKATPFDFDGDGRSDFMVTRPSDYNWHLLTNGTYNYTATHFGTSGDKVVPADYDGDGKVDIGIWRPSTGDWWWLASSTGVASYKNIGTSGDTPIPSDTDGSGTADMVVVSPSGLWKGIDAATGNVIVYHQFGQAGDKPVTGDFDGDGKSDLAYFRPSNGTWYYNKSSSGANLELGIVQWGLSTDIPAPADYDGDGKTDVAVYRPSEGNWYVLNSGGGYLIVHFGATGDKPIPADYDGDGKADIAVFRPSDGYWYQLPTTGGYTGLPWGISSDIPAPNALLIP